MDKLYEITGKLGELQEMLADSENAELAITETLDLIEGEFNDKAVTIVKMITNINSSLVEPLDAEIKRLQARKKAIQNKQESVKEYLRYNMEAAGIKKIECPQFAITLRKPSKVVKIIDESSIPVEFIEIKTEFKPNKAEIAKALKSGEEVSGCELVDGKSSLLIK